jgi:Tfp pilus assembly protein FimV
MLIRDADVATPAPTEATVAYGAVRVVAPNSSTATTKTPLVHGVNENRENQRVCVLERQVAEKDALLAQKDAEIATLQAMVNALQLRSSSSIEALVQTPTTRRDPVMTSSPFSLSSSSP